MSRLRLGILFALLVSGVLLWTRFLELSTHHPHGRASQAGVRRVIQPDSVPCTSEAWIVEHGLYGMKIPRPECWEFAGDPDDGKCVLGDTESSALPLMISVYGYRDDETRSELLQELLERSPAHRPWSSNGWKGFAFKRMHASEDDDLFTLEYLLFGEDSCVLLETGYAGEFDGTPLDEVLEETAGDVAARMAALNASDRSAQSLEPPDDPREDFWHWLAGQRLSYFRAVTELPTESPGGIDGPAEDDEELIVRGRFPNPGFGVSIQ